MSAPRPPGRCLLPLLALALALALGPVPARAQNDVRIDLRAGRRQLR